MAAFTMELWKAIEFSGGTVNRPNGIAVMGGGNIGLNHYPLFSELHREVLNGKIIDHYWNSEIGHETFHMWRQAVQAKMNEIMPPINKLYLSELIAFDPLVTVNLKNMSTGESDQISNAETEQSTAGKSDQEASTSGSSTTKADALNTSRGVNSTFPQTMLAGNEDYASSGADATGRSEQTGEGTQSGSSDSTTKTTEDSTGKSNANTNTKSTAETTTQGLTGPASLLLMQYRDTIINVDMMVIEQLAPLFMTVLDTGNSYFGGENGAYHTFGYAY